MFSVQIFSPHNIANCVPLLTRRLLLAQHRRKGNAGRRRFKTAKARQPGSRRARKHRRQYFGAASAAKRNAATQSIVSGLYTWKKSVWRLHRLTTPQDSEAGGKAISEELRLDVDGRYPQMVASGVIHGGIFSRVHWIANLVAKGPNTWTGDVFYTEGNKSSFPYKSVTIQVIPNATSELNARPKCFFPAEAQPIALACLSLPAQTFIPSTSSLISSRARRSC